MSVLSKSACNAEHREEKIVKELGTTQKRNRQWGTRHIHLFLHVSTFTKCPKSSKHIRMSIYVCMHVHTRVANNEHKFSYMPRAQGGTHIAWWYKTTSNQPHRTIYKARTTNFCMSAHRSTCATPHDKTHMYILHVLRRVCVREKERERERER